MELIDALTAVVGNLVTYGLLIVAVLFSFMLLATFGFGLIAVNVLHRLDANVAPVEYTAAGSPLDYHIIEVQVNHGGISYFSNVWYLASEQEYAGVKYVVLPDGRDLRDELSSSELDRISDIAEHAWEVCVGKP